MANVVRKAPAQSTSTGRFISNDEGKTPPWMDAVAKGKSGVGRKTAVKTPVGGMSIVAVDPGKTTGLAIWDAWDGKWYVDQLDAGRGRKARIRVPAGVVESAALIDGADKLGLRMMTGMQVVRDGGRTAKLAIDAIVEQIVVQTLIDVVLAVGPRCIVVFEDFVLGHAGGEGLSATQIGRDGLSPVRLNARFMQAADMLGIFTGDAWRTFTEHWWTGGDSRGVHVLTHDAVTGREVRGVPEFRKRLTRVEAARLGEVTAKPGHGAVWGGSGAQFVLNLPSQRVWMPGDAKAQEQWMRAEGCWMPGRPHGMVAMQHGHAVGRQIGLLDLSRPEKIWQGLNVKVRTDRKTAKSVLA